MPITVDELLADPLLRLEPIVAGDTRQTITWVHSSEMPDPAGAAFLRGGEVVLTAGVWYWAGATAQAFVDGLARVRAAALGFGVSSLVEEVPAPLIDACGAAGLTLFRVPPDMAFITITQTFVERFVEERERALRETLERNDRFVRAARDGRGLRGTLRVLRRYLDRPAWVLSPSRGLLAAGHRAPPAHLLEAVAALPAHADAPADVAGHSAFPVLGPPGTDAYLVLAVALAEVSVAERAILEQALAFLAVELQREAAVRESEQRFAAELFDLVAAGDTQLAAVEARLHALGLPTDAPLAGLVCRAPDVPAASARLRGALEERRLPNVTATKGAEVVALIPWAHPLEDLDALAAGLLAALGPDTALGAGSPADAPGDLRRTLLEARHACRIARRRRDAQYATYPQVGSHALLLALQDDQVLATFRGALLEPLLAQDARRHTALVPTIRAFLAADGHYQQTAARLHVHVNTLRLRLARIETLTGRDLSRLEDRVDFYLALSAAGELPAEDAGRA
jgi:PucR family transcriptional regulator, purine catabolism regulatory protein